MSSSDQVWFQTDDAWDFLPEKTREGVTPVDVREEALGLRFITSASKIETFARRHAAQFRSYTLFGSGDFHHLSAVWTRQFTEPFHILSFDNHPDWDIRPPRWSCGAWVNRALENPRVQTVNIWGCGNFECNLPGRLLGNRSVAQEGRLLVQPWAQEGRSYPPWLRPITAETWKFQFIDWLETIPQQPVYVTIDLDCLAPVEVFTNWENGCFSCEDLIWALAALREKARVIGGDLCGVWSDPQYQTSFQRLAGWFDHPRVPPSIQQDRTSRHLEVWQKLWPALTGSPS
jgi:arginase family enzyme